MEAANEAARHATRAILAREGVPKEKWPKVEELWQPPFFALARRLDKWRFEAGQPHHIDELDPAMPADFAARPEVGVKGLERQTKRPMGLAVMPAGWPDAPPSQWPAPPQAGGRLPGPRVPGGAGVPLGPRPPRGPLPPRGPRPPRPRGPRSQRPRAMIAALGSAVDPLECCVR